MNTLLMDRGFDGRDGGGFFFFLLTLVLFGTAIFFLVRAIRRWRGWDGSQPDSRRILDERFARGEIDRSEYEHRKAVLDGADVIPPAPAGAVATTPTPPPSPSAPPEASGPETPREPNDS